MADTEWKELTTIKKGTKPSDTRLRAVADWAVWLKTRDGSDYVLVNQDPPGLCRPFHSLGFLSVTNSNTLPRLLVNTSAANTSTILHLSRLFRFKKSDPPADWMMYSFPSRRVSAECYPRTAPSTTSTPLFLFLDMPCRTRKLPSTHYFSRSTP